MKNAFLPILFLIAASSCYAQTPILWGMTREGGIDSSGMIFSYDATTGVETDIHDFGRSTDGKDPHGSLVKAKNGILYGMTSQGGTNNARNGGDGIIFSYDILSDIYTELYDFGSGNDGQYPYGSLMQANDGLLYGMTYNGGTNGKGAIFSYDISTGKENVLHSFGAGTDGYWPWGSLIQVENNHLLYGMTAYGGVNNEGIIFSYNISNGEETDLYDFGNGNDGYRPWGSLTYTKDDLLYGTTSLGGINDNGTIFSYNISSGTEKVIHNFGAGADGRFPFYGSLIHANNGLLYGVTKEGGTIIKNITSGYGTIFSCGNTDTTETILHNFGSGNDGVFPFSSLTQARNGVLYGMTEKGGVNSGGIIFSYNIATGKDTILHNFGRGDDGKYPYGDLVEDNQVSQIIWWKYPAIIGGIIVFAVGFLVAQKGKKKKTKNSKPIAKQTSFS